MRRFLLLLVVIALPCVGQQQQVPSFLCGTWQYYSGGGTYTGGSYSVSRYFTLYPNGTYEFVFNNDNSGGNGSASGSGRDTGHWWVVGNVQAAKLCARNQSGENFQFELELRNHPKTHDPMIVLDGDAYVTATQREPWPDL